MPRLTSSDSTYLGAEVPLEVAAEFKRRARDHERSATGQLRQLIREFAPDRRKVQRHELLQAHADLHDRAGAADRGGMGGSRLSAQRGD